MSANDHEILARFADGEAAPHEELHALTLIERCELSRGDVERWRALRECACRSLHADCPPPTLHDSLAASVAQAARGHAIRYWTSFAAVAALVVFASLHLDRPALSSSGGAARATLLSAERFAEIYRACGVRGHAQLSLSSNCPILARETIGKSTRFRVVLPDYRSAEFELAGICRCFRSPDVQVVHVAYRSREPEPRHVSVFSVNACATLAECAGCDRRCCGKSLTYDSAIVDGVNVLTWRCGNATFAVVSDMERTQLVRFADQASTALAAGAPHDAPIFALAESIAATGDE